MAEMITVSKADWEALEERARKLALEKSHLQLLIQMMNSISAASGFENVVENIPRHVIGAIGGENAVLYYKIDEDLFCVDALGEKAKVGQIRDELVRRAFDTGQISEQEDIFSKTRMLTPEFTKAYTWVFPLAIGPDVIGAFRLENVHISMRELYTQLPLFFSYVALVLRNEIMNRARLMRSLERLRKSNARLNVEMEERKRADDELRQAKAALEARVIERTAELRQVNEQLQVELAERKRAEEAKAKLAAIVESSDDAIISKTLDGVILTWNRGAERIFGYAAEEVIGRPILLLIPRELQDEETKILQSICRGEHVDHYETVRIARDGRRIDVSLTVSPIKDAAGRIVGASKITRDITERKRAEEALKEAYGSLQAFFNHRIGGIGIVRATVEGDIVQANDYYLKMVGRTRAELEAGQVRWVELTAPEWHAATEKALAQVRESGVCDTYEKEYVRRDGTHVPVLMTYAMMPGTKGEFVAFVLDITERKEAEKALLRAKEELEQRVEERTAQIRTLALDLTHAEQMERKRLAMALHDNLQQLLVGAKIGLEMAGRKAAGPDIKESLNSVAALLDESIGVSRTLTLEMSPPILHEAGLVAGINWLGRWMLEKYGLTVEIESDAEIAADIEGVCMLLFQCVRELLLNVVKHSGVKSAQVSIRLTDDHIRVIVSDQGVGFDPSRTEAKETVFGFGLFSIRERLRLVGGQMEVESAPARGVRVSLVAPLPAPPALLNE